MGPFQVKVPTPHDNTHPLPIPKSLGPVAREPGSAQGGEHAASVCPVVHTPALLQGGERSASSERNPNIITE